MPNIGGASDTPTPPHREKRENLPSWLASSASSAQLLDRGPSRGRGSSKTPPPEPWSTNKDEEIGATEGGNQVDRQLLKEPTPFCNNNWTTNGDVWTPGGSRFLSIYILDLGHAIHQLNISLHLYQAKARLSKLGPTNRRRPRPSAQFRGHLISYNFKLSADANQTQVSQFDGR